MTQQTFPSRPLRPHARNIRQERQPVPCALSEPIPHAQMSVRAGSPAAGWPWLLAAVLSVSGIVLLFLMVVIFALPLFAQGGEGGPFGWQWLPSGGYFGILPMLCGTLALSCSALLLAFPLALGLCCHLHCAGPSPSLAARLLGGLMRGMSAVPTVTYGFAALFLLTPLLRSALGGTGLCWLGAALMLSLLVLPTLVLVMDAGLRPRMERLRPAGAALGMTPVRIWLFLALPEAGRAVLSAAVLAFGRAAGDTLLPLMLAGNAPQAPQALTDSLRALTAHMALVTSNEVGGGAYDSLFAAGALLLLCNACMSLLARHWQRTASEEAAADACAVLRSGPAEEACVMNMPSAAGGRRLALPPVGIGCLAWLAAQLRWLSPLLVSGAAVALGVFLVLRGLPAVDASLFFGDTPVWDAILGRMPVWDGIWPACAGTAGLICLSMALAVFPGLGCGVYLAEYATPRQRRWIGCAADMLAGVPSIVMGLFGFSLIVFLRRTFFPQANTCLLLAAACLALLVLPVLIAAAREAVEAVPQELRLTAAALGLTPGQSLRHIILPAAARGMGGGAVLALGRAAEDTAVIMLTGAVANAGLPAGLAAKFEALPFFIYYTAAEYQSEAELARGFGASLLLLLLSCLLLVAAHGLARRGRARI